VRTFEGKKNKDSADHSIAREAAPGHSKSDVEFNNLFDLLSAVENATKSRRNSTEDGPLPAVDESSEDEGSQDQLSSSTKKSKRTTKSGKKKGKGKGRKPKSQKSIVKTSTSMDVEEWDDLEWTPISGSNEWDAEDEEDELYFMIVSL
jgi:hypothetical protein